MRTPPDDQVIERLRSELSRGWGLRVASIEYVPEGGGSHHWRVVDGRGRRHFVTVDDLDDKDWLGDARESVYDGLRRALATAYALRHTAGLDCVVAPVPADDGALVHRLDPRYTAAVFEYLDGHSYPFGPYRGAPLRDVALDMVAGLHRATSLVEAGAPFGELRYGGRRDLDALLADPDHSWDDGPYGEPARRLLVEYVPELTRLVSGFWQLAEATTAARVDAVVTHGEPHPANLMTVHGRVLLIDWDTVALAPPERDLALIVSVEGEGIDRYERATGRSVDRSVLTLYRLRWYLDDVASAVRMFRNPHRETADTRRWWEALPGLLAEAGGRLAALA